MSEKYKILKVKELQELLQKNSLPYSGKKEELIDRLVKNDERKALESLEKEFELDDDLDDSKINLNDIPQDIFTPIPLEKDSIAEKESVLSDDEEVEFIISKPPATTAATKEKPVASTVIKPSASATTKSPTSTPFKRAKNPSKSVIPSTNVISSGSKATSNSTDSTTVTATATATTSFKFTPITFDKKPAFNTTTTTSSVPEKKVMTPQLDEATEKLKKEAERRLLRSKRFGVKLDENEMKEIRAARFGITPSTTEADEKTKKGKNVIAKENKENGKATNKPPTQEQILKKRAERFGLSVAEEKKPVAVVDEKKTAKGKKGNKKVVETESKKKNTKILQNNAKGGKVSKVAKKVAVAITASGNNKKKAIATTRVSLVKQKMIKKAFEKTDIIQNKKKIVNHPKVNFVNTSNTSAKQGDRIVTYETNTTGPITKSKKRDNSNNTNAPTRNVVIQHNNSRKVIIADSPPQEKSRNSNKNATRKRGRGFEKKKQQQPQQVNNNNNKRKRKN